MSVEDRLPENTNEVLAAVNLYTQEEMDKIRDEAYMKGGLDGLNLTKENL